VTVQEKPFFGGQAYLKWAEIHLATIEGRWAEAVAGYQALDKMSAQLGIPWYRARILAEWAEAHIYRGEAEDLKLADKLYQQANQIFRQLSLPTISPT
jgi:hypothetical protein